MKSIIDHRNRRRSAIDNRLSAIIATSLPDGVSIPGPTGPEASTLPLSHRPPQIVTYLLLMAGVIQFCKQKVAGIKTLKTFCNKYLIGQYWLNLESHWPVGAYLVMPSHSPINPLYLLLQLLRCSRLSRQI